MLQQLVGSAAGEGHHEDVVAIVVGDAVEHEILGLELGTQLGGVDLDRGPGRRERAAELVEVGSPSIPAQLGRVGHGPEDTPTATPLRRAARAGAPGLRRGLLVRAGGPVNRSLPES